MHNLLTQQPNTRKTGHNENYNMVNNSQIRSNFGIVKRNSALNTMCWLSASIVDGLFAAAPNHNIATPIIALPVDFQTRI